MTCGVCLKDDVDVMNIFGEEGRRLDISAVIKQHFWFEPIEDDTILSRICCPCWEQIANFHLFYTQVKDAHKTLSERYYAGSQYTAENYNDFYQPDARSLGDQPECSYGYVNPTEGTVGSPNLSNCGAIFRDKQRSKQNAEGNKNDESYYNESVEGSQNTNEIVQEDGYLLEKGDFDPSEDFDDIDDNDSSMDFEQRWRKNNAPRRSTNFVEKGTPVKDKPVNRDSLSFKRDPRNKTRISRKDSNKVDDEDAFIAKHIKLDCELCSEKFKKFFDLCKHYQSAHSISGYVRCCDKKLPSRAYALDHINQHVNPESYRCKECNKTFSSQYAIKNHLAIKHAPEIDKIFQCEYCPEKFTNQHHLNQHCTRHISEEERRVYCMDCRKTFPTALALQMHKNVYHGKLQGHICHVCGKIVRGKAVFAKHVNEHAAELGQETINDPVCPICGKLSASIKTLRHHIRYVHSSHRPHKCTICGKAFKIRQKLKEHMGSHAIGNLFPCPYCHKRFRSKLHLYSHKYRMHKQEYDEEKQTRFNMMTETFSGVDNYENTSMSENDTQQYDDGSIVLSEDSTQEDEDDDCYVVT